jgi:hypothetical protein
MRPLYNPLPSNLLYRLHLGLCRHVLLYYLDEEELPNCYLMLITTAHAVVFSHHHVDPTVFDTPRCRCHPYSRTLTIPPLHCRSSDGRPHGGTYLTRTLGIIHSCCCTSCLLKSFFYHLIYAFYSFFIVLGCIPRFISFSYFFFFILSVNGLLMVLFLLFLRLLHSPPLSIAQLHLTYDLQTGSQINSMKISSKTCAWEL